MSTQDEILASLNADERKNLRRKLDALDEHDDRVDWGSLGDSELEVRKHELFRRTKNDSRRKALEAKRKALTDG